MARAHFVKAARKPNKEHGIKKGDSYYWWKFRFGGKRISKTRPCRSQLTQSVFWGPVFDLQDREMPTEYDDLQGAIDDLKSELETLKDEQEEKRQNMPEQLQESASGELLQNRYDSLESVISDLDSVDVPDRDAVLIDAAEGDEPFNETEVLRAKIEEIWDEVTSALGNISD